MIQFLLCVCDLKKKKRKRDEKETQERQKLRGFFFSRTPPRVLHACVFVCFSRFKTRTDFFFISVHKQRKNNFFFFFADEWQKVQAEIQGKKEKRNRGDV